MSKGARVYFDDILESIAHIENYTNKITEKEFSKNEMLQDAVVRRFEIIGEAVKNIPQIFKEQYTDIPWGKIAGMRDVLIHAYSGINIKRIWKTTKDDLPDLKKCVEKIIDELDKQEIKD